MGAQIVRFEDLPSEFADLQAIAIAEGHTFLERLPQRWHNGQYLDDPNAAVMGAWIAGELAAIGAQTTDEYDPHPDHRRIRHFYVLPQHRRDGLGRSLASSLLQEALHLAPIVHLRATYAASIAFWDAVGFTRVLDRPDRTHRMTRS